LKVAGVTLASKSANTRREHSKQNKRYRGPNNSRLLFWLRNGRSAHFTAATTRDRVGHRANQVLFAGQVPVGSGPCGNIILAGGAAVVDVLMYLAFGVVMIGCLWFIDSSLKNGRD
jgi:hypothetical protein